MDRSVLKFQPWTSSVEVPFWYEFSQKKLDEFRLSEDPVSISAYYTTGYSSSVEPQFYLNNEAFQANFKPPGSHFPAPGTLYNMNTLQSFKELDKKQLTANAARKIWDSILSGDALKNPTLLSHFFVLAYADLKKYHYYYWFTFPALTSTDLTTVTESKQLSDVWSPDQVSSLTKFVESTRSDQEWINQTFFLVKIGKDGNLLTDRLANYHQFSSDGEVSFVFFDPGNTTGTPGWPLRNFLTLLNVNLKLTTASIILFKNPRGDTSGSTSSQFLKLKLSDFSAFNKDLCPTAVGLEKDHKGKMLPKFTNMAKTMDSKKLAENACDLNLKLMKWRVLPTLDLQRVSQTKCLLLGAGTLGCNVARALISWGVRHITFVDNGKVSYSNPVRQTLYTFADSKEGKMKAQTAAEAVMAIFPSCVSKGVNMTIPMPGHPVDSKTTQETKKAFDDLVSLIAEHDVIYLGLDSREARWLPSVIAGAHGKLVVNVALGFDNFVIFRHGMAPTKEHQQTPRLGCYFCNDVVAPRDSFTDRTLDQQCTVTRPGLSFMASSQAVEIMVSVLHHPLRAFAPGETKPESGQRSSTELGIVPHTIRGYLRSFENHNLTGLHYDRCVACSDSILAAYKSDPWEFCLSVFNNPLVLEDVSGISVMKEEVIDFGCEDDWEED